MGLRWRFVSRPVLNSCAASTTVPICTHQCTTTGPGRKEGHDTIGSRTAKEYMGRMLVAWQEGGGLGAGGGGGPWGRVHITHLEVLWQGLGVCSFVVPFGVQVVSHLHNLQVPLHGVGHGSVRHVEPLLSKRVLRTTYNKAPEHHLFTLCVGPIPTTGRHVPCLPSSSQHETPAASTVNKPTQDNTPITLSWCATQRR